MRRSCLVLSLSVWLMGCGDSKSSGAGSGGAPASGGTGGTTSGGSTSSGGNGGNMTVTGGTTSGPTGGRATGGSAGAGASTGGKVTDPITKARFRPTASSPSTIHAGRIYYFSADSTRVQFLANPTLHQDRRTGTS